MLAHYGRTAADDLGNVICVALLLACLGGRADEACLVFIAGMSLLAHSTAGIAKMPHAGWFDGSFVLAVSSTRSFGLSSLAALMRRLPWLPRLVGWAIVLAESLFPLVVVLPMKWAVAILTIGLLFHCAVAPVMGLNTFVWAFPATYPAILFTNHLAHKIR